MRHPWRTQFVEGLVPTESHKLGSVVRIHDSAFCIEDSMDAEHLDKKIEGLRIDILHSHLPRLTEGLKGGYPDENQALIVYDHMVRMRALIEIRREIDAE